MGPLVRGVFTLTHTLDTWALKGFLHPYVEVHVCTMMILGFQGSKYQYCCFYELGVFSVIVGSILRPSDLGQLPCIKTLQTCLL